MMAYVGFCVRHRHVPGAFGVVDVHDAVSALVWWGYRPGHRNTHDGRRWVRWEEVEVFALNPVTFNGRIAAETVPAAAMGDQIRWTRTGGSEGWPPAAPPRTAHGHEKSHGQKTRTPRGRKFPRGAPPPHPKAILPGSEKSQKCLTT